jgi:hypothetical protein
MTPQDLAALQMKEVMALKEKQAAKRAALAAKEKEN